MHVSNSTATQHLAKALVVCVAAIIFAPAAPGQTAQVQLIHASPFAEVDTVDIYLADTLAVDDFAYLTATTQIELPGRVPIDVAITASDAASADEAVWQRDLALNADSLFWLVAAGDPLGREGFAAFDVFVHGQSMNDAPEPDEFAVTDFHAVPDVDEVNFKINNETFASNLSFGENSSWFFIEPDPDAFLTLQTSDQVALAAYKNDWTVDAVGLGVFGIHTGFRSDPATGESSLVYMAVRTDGVVVIAEEARTRVFFANASAYPEAEYVSLWIGNAMAADSVAFNSGTATFEWFPGLQPMNIRTPSGVSPSRVFRAEIRQLKMDETVLLVAAGDPMKREGQPRLLLYQKNAPWNNEPEDDTVNLLAFNAIADSPPLNYRFASSGNLIFSDVEYGTFSDNWKNITHGFYTHRLESGGKTYAEIESDLTDPWPSGTALALETGFFRPPGDTLPSYSSRWIFSDGTVWEFPVTVGTEDEGNAVPERFALRGNYPNPFNPQTRIVFDLPELAEIGLNVYDLSGRLVHQLPATTQPAGANQQIIVDGSSLSSGTYFYQLIKRSKRDHEIVSGKMILLK